MAGVPKGLNIAGLLHEVTDWAKKSVQVALSAGDNKIGKVDVDSLPPIPSGSNNIGDVDIASALPPGSNVIGQVRSDDSGDWTAQNRERLWQMAGAKPEIGRLLCSLGGGLDHVCGFAYGRGDYLYAASNTSPAILAKIDRHTMREVARLTLPQNETRVNALFAVDDRLIVHGSYGNPYVLTFVDGEKMEITGSLEGIEEATNDKHIRHFAFDGELLYVLCDTSPGKVVRVNPFTRTRVDSAMLNAGESTLHGCVILRGMLYLCCATDPGKVVKLDTTKAPIDRVAAFTCEEGENKPRTIATDGEFLYVSMKTAANKMKVHKLDPVTMTSKASYTSAGEYFDSGYSIAVSGSSVLAIPWDRPAVVHQLKRADLTLEKQFEVADGYLSEVYYIPPYWYAAHDTSNPGRVTRMLLGG